MNDTQRYQQFKRFRVKLAEKNSPEFDELTEEAKDDVVQTIFHLEHVARGDEKLWGWFKSLEKDPTFEPALENAPETPNKKVNLK